MKNGLLLVGLMALTTFCSSPEIDGNWNAKWTTLPESFQGIPDIESFEMNGNFIFNGDSITITAMGFPGCVFGIDTISHTQGWRISGDTLYLINREGQPGISYVIKEQQSNLIKLQLMDDIFVDLTK
ncbi:MAG: hypothetical protein JXQ90_13210 [Cyclobacteriaceae bacterium]